jgi:hypothetical protein
MPSSTNGDPVLKPPGLPFEFPQDRQASRPACSRLSWRKQAAFPTTRTSSGPRMTRWRMERRRRPTAHTGRGTSKRPIGVPPIAPARSVGRTGAAGVAADVRVKTVAMMEHANQVLVRLSVPGRNAAPMDVKAPAVLASRTSTAMTASANPSAAMVTASVERRVRRALGTAARAARTGRATTVRLRRRAQRIAPGSASRASALGRRRTGRTGLCGWRFRPGAS